MKKTTGKWIPIGEFPRNQPEESGTKPETVHVVMEMLRAIDEIATQIPEMAEMLLKKIKYSKKGSIKYTGPKFDEGQQGPSLFEGLVRRSHKPGGF